MITNCDSFAIDQDTKHKKEEYKKETEDSIGEKKRPNLPKSGLQKSFHKKQRIYQILSLSAIIFRLTSCEIPKIHSLGIRSLQITEGEISF